MIEPRVMGLDLAAEQSGVALPDDTTVAIKAKKVSGTRTLADDQARMDHVEASFSHLLAVYRPNLLVVEDYAAHAKGAGLHRLAEIGGNIRLACWRADVPIALVNLTHVKIYATGNGAATKSQMATSAQGRAGLVFPTEDECDAWWMRAMGCDWLGQPIVKVPEAQRDVLQRVKGWPEATW
ncbi:crossover junction endodeoxyribonuclease RuvC [Nonomuraea sp. NPDC049152]|uniref:crossover junction endodeoxyribonuclease RuvC n=1 Tax=Nonomuraea sp. NPDC049152 TaxID=3154350 RepID=UPI0033D40FC5